MNIDCIQLAREWMGQDGSRDISEAYCETRDVFRESNS